MTLTNITGDTLKFEGLTLHIPVNKLLRICKRGGRGLRAQGHQSPERSWNTTLFLFIFYLFLLNLSSVRGHICFNCPFIFVSFTYMGP